MSSTAGRLKRGDLGVRPAEPLMMPMAHQRAVAHDDGPDHRVRFDRAGASGGFRQGSGHPEWVGVGEGHVDVHVTASFVELACTRHDGMAATKNRKQSEEAENRGRIKGRGSEATGRNEDARGVGERRRRSASNQTVVPNPAEFALCS